MIVAIAFSIQFYSYENFQGVLLKNLEGCDKITSMISSTNGAYFLSGDSLGIIRVWDHDADEASPYYY